MIHLPADDTPLSVLCSLVEPVVLYDATGTRVIGHFTPVDPERGKRKYEELAARIDPQEIARRKAGGERGKTLDEVLARANAGTVAPTSNGGVGGQSAVSSE